MDAWSLRPVSVDPEPVVVQMGNITHESEAPVQQAPQHRVKRKYTRRIQIEKETNEDG